MSQTLFYGIAGGLILGLIVLEIRVPSFRRDAFSDRVRAGRNWAYLVSILGMLFLVGVAAHQIPKLVPTLVRVETVWPVDFLLCLLVGEGFNYGLHYAMHWNPYLWRFHFQHHRESNYNLWLAAHLHGLEAFASACMMSALFTLLGFSVPAKQAYFLFFTFVTTYHHSANNYTLGFLDRIIISPAYHRLHHDMGVRGNYGSTLTILDRLFGTRVAPPERPLRYGIGSKREPYGFWKEFLYMLPLKASRP